jgi:hypothetical protein
MIAALENAAAEGWDFFEHRHDPARGAQQKRVETTRGERVALSLARFASSPDGAEALEFLLDATLRRATFTAQLGLDPMQAYSFGVFREGQNALMASILKLIAQGRKDETSQQGREP